MEIVSGVTPSLCSSIFFNRPAELISAISHLGLGLQQTPSEDRFLSESVDFADKREGLQKDGNYLDNAFIEIHYRLLEKKNELHGEIFRALPDALADDSLDTNLHQNLLDKINEVLITSKKKICFYHDYVNFFLKK